MDLCPIGTASLSRNRTSLGAYQRDLPTRRARAESHRVSPNPKPPSHHEDDRCGSSEPPSRLRGAARPKPHEQRLPVGVRDPIAIEIRHDTRHSARLTPLLSWPAVRRPTLNLTTLLLRIALRVQPAISNTTTPSRAHPLLPRQHLAALRAMSTIPARPAPGASSQTEPSPSPTPAHDSRRSTAVTSPAPAQGSRRTSGCRGTPFLADQQRACLLRTCRFRPSWNLEAIDLRCWVGSGCSRASLRTGAVVVRDRRPGPA